MQEKKFAKEKLYAGKALGLERFDLRKMFGFKKINTSEKGKASLCVLKRRELLVSPRCRRDRFTFIYSINIYTQYCQFSAAKRVMVPHCPTS